MEFITDFYDFGIIVIKPDGVKINIMDECEEEIKKRKINILAKKYFYLEEDDVKKYFYYNFKEYVEYMCGDKICVYFLQAENIDLDVEVYSIKKKIRDNHKVNGKMMNNYIHGSHCGTEFFLQRKLFFPEYDSIQYSSGYDMYCCTDWSKEILWEKVNNIKENGHVRKIVFDVVPNSLEHFQKVIEEKGLKNYVDYCNSEIVTIKDIKCRIIQYHTREKGKVINFLGQLEGVQLERPTGNSLEAYNFQNRELTNLFFDRLIEKITLQGKEIKGILINSPQMSLNEAECRYEYAKEKGYYLSGGSENIDCLGLFGMSRDKVLQICGD